MKEFGGALSGADEVVLTDIYPAGEAPIPGVTLDALADECGGRPRGPHVVPALDECRRPLPASRSGDLIITLGAGSIGGVGERILEAVRQGRPSRRRTEAAVKVSAATEKNFRRPRSKPSRKRRWRALFSWQVSRRSGSCW